MMSQKGFTHTLLIIGLVVALVVVLGLAFWRNFTQSDSTAKESELTTMNKPDKKNIYSGWKTYSNYEDGYGIKYPSDWVFIDKTTSDGIYIRNFDPASRPAEDSENNKNYPKGYINLSIIKIDGNDPIFNGSTAKDWYEKLGKSSVSLGPVTYSPDAVKAFDLQNKPAKTTKAVFTETNEDIFLLHNDSLYRFNLYPYGISKDETVKRILDSFIYTMNPKDAIQYIQD